MAQDVAGTKMALKSAKAKTAMDATIRQQKKQQVQQQQLLALKKVHNVASDCITWPQPTATALQ